MVCHHLMKIQPLSLTINADASWSATSEAPNSVELGEFYGMNGFKVSYPILHSALEAKATILIWAMFCVSKVPFERAIPRFLCRLAVNEPFLWPILLLLLCATNRFCMPNYAFSLC